MNNYHPPFTEFECKQKNIFKFGLPNNFNMQSNFKSQWFGLDPYTDRVADLGKTASRL